MDSPGDQSDKPNLRAVLDRKSCTTVSTDPGQDESASQFEEGRAPVPKPGDVILNGKYRIDRVIGEGGVSVVTAATHLAMGRVVAFKFHRPRPGRASSANAFVREARTSASVVNDHVGQVFDVGITEQGVPYLLMEHLDGIDLCAYLRRRGALPLEEAVDIILQICEALAASHAIGVVHRDLKPANVFICRNPAGMMHVKVLDFGISKLLSEKFDGESTVSKPGKMVGTPYYMSPEQVQMMSVDTRTDIWALGLILHEMLTGEQLYGKGTLSGVISAILVDSPTSVRALRPEIPESIDDVIGGCLAKRIDDRFSSVLEVAEAFVSIVGPAAEQTVHRIENIESAPAMELELPRLLSSPSFGSRSPAYSGHIRRSSSELTADRAATKKRFPAAVGVVTAALALIGVSVWALASYGIAPTPGTANATSDMATESVAHEPLTPAQSAAASPSTSASAPASAASAPSSSANVLSTNAAPVKTRRPPKANPAPRKVSTEEDVLKTRR